MKTATLPKSLNAWLDLLEGRHPGAIDLGLERCGAVWRRMGSPRPAQSLFIVAGTNGKGSTAATICSLLDGLGYRYGSYTTPHIYRYNERIQVNAQPAPDALLVDAFERVEAARGDTRLTYFEFGTLAAFQLLADAGLDHAVMEVGLGGRLDAVNLLDADVAVITPIGLDHQEYLGDDLESIAREKAGVIRPGQTVICGAENPPASLQAMAMKAGARLLRLGADFLVRLVENGVRFTSAGVDLLLPTPALSGPHQLDNMATALAAVLELLPEAAERTAALARGIRSVRLPGRLQRVKSRPAVWLDVGHNPMAALAVANALLPDRKSGSIRNCRCVLAMLSDKDAAGVAAELRPLVTHWYCAGLPGSRGQTGAQLASRLSDAAGAAPVGVFESVEDALHAALADATLDDGVLVFGSFLTVAAAGSQFAARSAASTPGGTDTWPGRC